MPLVMRCVQVAICSTSGTSVLQVEPGVLPVSLQLSHYWLPTAVADLIYTGFSVCCRNAVESVLASVPVAVSGSDFLPPLQGHYLLYWVGAVLLVPLLFAWHQFDGWCFCALAHVSLT